MSHSTKELYEFSRFRLDVAERLLWRDGKRVALADKAFDTLCVLVKRGGQLVGKDELMNEVWAGAIVEENNLDQKISMLRQALGERLRGKEKFIETVRGHGYRFLPEVRRVVVEPENDGAERAALTNRAKIETNFPVAAPHHETRRDGNVLTVAKWQREEIPASAADEEAQEKRGNAEMRQPDARETATTGLSKFLNAVNQHRRLALYGLAALVLVTVAGFAWSRWFQAQRLPSNAAALPIDSIAILPFDNAVQDANAEYLSDGITESLINRLSQLSNLKVVSRSVVFRYKGKAQDASKVSKDLNVQAVLTGSVKQIGDQIVITVRLENAENNQHLWGEQYVRKFADILNVQNEIAQAVSTNLRVKLSGADQQQLAKRYTDSVDAYQLYLKGNYKWEQHTLEDLQKAIDYYSQAIEKDPNYALAYAGLAKCYGRLGNSYRPPHEAFPQAKTYNAKALELDETLAEAHASMAAVRLFYDWDWAEADREIKRALVLNPDYEGTLDMQAVYLDVMGRNEEALVEVKRALALDPLSLSMNTAVGEDYYYTRQYDEAIAQLKKAIDLDPHYFRAYLWLGRAYEQKKMYREAIATYQNGMSRAQRHPQLVSSIGYAFALAGERDKAQQALAELRDLATQRYISPYLFATVYMGLGEKEQAFAWLEKTYQDRSFWLIWMKAEPRFDPLRDDPRFKDLLRRLGL